MIKQCIICEKFFETNDSINSKSFNRRKCCSRRCSNIWKSKITRGRPKSKEHRRKISISHQGKKRPPFSLEWRKNLSRAAKGRPKSPEHRKKIGDAHRGEKASNWKGGKTFQREYTMIKSPNHPKQNSSGYVREHILIMEKYIGRFLKDGEVVHHVNENKFDNRIENLMLFPSQSSHMKFHNINRK